MSDVHREIQHRIEGNRVGLLGELCCCWYLNAALCSQRNVDCIQLLKKIFFNPITGASQMLVMKAGSNPFLLEKSSPEKMLTLTCLPKKKTTTCIKYSVCIAGSGTQLMITTTVNKPMKSVWSCCLLMLCFFSSFVAVHNVKPECLDAYNELWYESLLCYLNSDVTLEHFFWNQYVRYFAFSHFFFSFCLCLQWGCLAFHSHWPWIPLWACGHLEHMVWGAGSGR